MSGPEPLPSPTDISISTIFPITVRNIKIHLKSTFPKSMTHLEKKPLEVSLITLTTNLEYLFLNKLNPFEILKMDNFDIHYHPHPNCDSKNTTKRVLIVHSPKNLYQKFIIRRNINGEKRKEQTAKRGQHSIVFESFKSILLSPRKRLFVSSKFKSSSALTWRTVVGKREMMGKSKRASKIIKIIAGRLLPRIRRYILLTSKVGHFSNQEQVKLRKEKFNFTDDRNRHLKDIVKYDSNDSIVMNKDNISDEVENIQDRVFFRNISSTSIAIGTTTTTHNSSCRSRRSNSISSESSSSGCNNDSSFNTNDQHVTGNANGGYYFVLPEKMGMNNNRIVDNYNELITMKKFPSETDIKSFTTVVKSENMKSSSFHSPDNNKTKQKQNQSMSDNIDIINGMKDNFEKNTKPSFIQESPSSLPLNEDVIINESYEIGYQTMHKGLKSALLAYYFERELMVVVLKENGGMKRMYEHFYLIL